MTKFLRKRLISVESSTKNEQFSTKNTQIHWIFTKKHTFSEKRVSFLRILRKRRTLPKGRIYRFSNEFTQFQQKTHIFRKKRCHFCKLCEKDARFPRVEFVEFPNNSLNVDEKRTNSLNVHKFIKQLMRQLLLKYITEIIIQAVHAVRKTCLLIVQE